MSEEEPMVTDMDKEEFFLSKNSKLFSQVSTNTLQATEQQKVAEPTGCKVVEVKAMEIVKAAVGDDDRVVLPKANFGVQQVPQVG